MQRRTRNMALLLAGAAAATVVGLVVQCNRAWSGPELDPVRDTARLQALLPALSADKIEGFRQQDWCQSIVYAGGVFASNTQTTCVLGVPDAAAGLDPHAAAALVPPLDATAQRVSERVAAAVAATGVSVMIIDDVRFTPSGAVARARFHLDSCATCRDSYVYEPGYPALPEQFPGDAPPQAISRDWYLLREEWN